MTINKISFPFFVLSSLVLVSWGEDPRIKDHNKLTGKLLKLANEQTGADECEEKILDEKCKEDLLKQFGNAKERREWRRAHAQDDYNSR